MARLLLAWELGAGVGHAMPLTQLSRVLLERGHEVHLVWKDLSICSELLQDLLDHPHLHIWQAPIWLRGTTGLPAAASYPELLLRAGYADAGRLLGCARGWQRLFAAIEPDLVVADHAPTAMLVARASPIRVAMFGSGFMIPPARSPMPSFRAWEAVDASRLAASEAQVLDSSNVVLAALGKPPMAALQELLQVDEFFMLGWPELDHLQDLRADHPLPSWNWPLPARIGSPPHWPSGRSERRLLAYLSSDHPAIEAVLNILRDGPWSALVHLVGTGAAEAGTRSAGSLVVVDRLIDMSSALADADLVICHAGAGTLYVALQANVPALMLPMQAEQLLLARRVAATGAGVLMWPDEVASRFATVLAAMLGSPGFATAAQTLAGRQDNAATDVLERIAARCEALSAPGR